LGCGVPLPALGSEHGARAPATGRFLGHEGRPGPSREKGPLEAVLLAGSLVWTSHSGPEEVT